MRHRPVDSWSRVALTIAAAIVLVACSSDDDDAAAPPTSAEAPASTAAPATTQPPASSSEPAPTTTATITTTAATTTTAAPSATAATTTTAAPTTTTTVAPVTDAVEIGEVDPGPEDEPLVLSPGPYTLGILAPYAFEIDEDLQVPIAVAEFVMIRDPSWPIEDRAGSIYLFELNGLVPPDLAADESVRNVNGPAQPDQMLASPVDFPAWIDAVPNVSVGDSGVIESPATTVWWWDVVVDADAGPTFRCAADTADCIGSFVSSPDWTGVLPLQAQNLQRIYLFEELPGMFGLVDAREAEFFERGVEIMEMIVGSLAPTA